MGRENLNFEINRVRAVVLAVAMLLAVALLVQTAQPVGADAAQKNGKKLQKNKKKNKKKKKAKKPKWPKKAPAGLSFYNKPPKKLPTAHGKLIWQRKASGLVPLASASSTKLVLYTSKSVTGKIVAVSGSVSFPKGKAPKGGWPLVTFAHSTTGIADKCAPSRNGLGGAEVSGVSYIDGVLNGWLDAGYAVARTDFQGLGTPGVHPYLVGTAAGRDVLDIARVARQLGPKVSNKYLIAGHSQGGHAALFAAGLATKWTPELKLRGTASYAPGSHLKTMAMLLPALTTPNELSGIAGMLFRGASTAYPSLDPQTMLSDEALQFYPDTDKECLDRLSQPDSLGSLAPSKLLRAGVDPTPLYEVLDQQNPAVTTAAPILLLQGTNDTATLPSLTDMLNGELVDLGNTVDYKVYPGLDHWVLVDEAQPDVLGFFRRQLPSGR